MAEDRRRTRSSTTIDYISEKLLLGDMTLDHSLSDEHRSMAQLRQCWELASVFNFLRIFRSVLPKDLNITAEEIETSLITNNENLGRIHIALLKGIPPINKNLTDLNAWITSVCKKLETWWPWVAEGENPLKADHGKEILSYKQLDPTTRLLILKALCDVRAEQDDILQFIADELKNGTTVSFFRKERMEVGDGGASYWYEGDEVIGHRLYRELGNSDSKPNRKAKGRMAQPAFGSQWETIATNFEEFSEIMNSLSSSNAPGEAFVGEIIKSEIFPLVEKLEKKKERALKRQQKQASQLSSFFSCRIGPTRSCRRPVSYTFDEYDRSIDEAIEISTDPKYVEPRKTNTEHYNNGLKTLNKYFGNDDDDDDDDDWHNDDMEVNGDDGGGGIGSGGDDDDDLAKFDPLEEKADVSSSPAHEKKRLNVRFVSGLRRSNRNTGPLNPGNFDAYHAVTKKRLRQRPTKNSGFIEIITDSEEDNNPVKCNRETAVDLSSTDDASSDGSQDNSREDGS